MPGREEQCLYERASLEAFPRIGLSWGDEREHRRVAFRKVFPRADTGSSSTVWCVSAVRLASVAADRAGAVGIQLDG